MLTEDTFITTLCANMRGTGVAAQLNERDWRIFYRVEMARSLTQRAAAAEYALSPARIGQIVRKRLRMARHPRWQFAVRWWGTEIPADHPLWRRLYGPSNGTPEEMARLVARRRGTPAPSPDPDERPFC